MRILTWNLFHGRSLPGVNRSLYREFAAMLEKWSWDLALLQEVPPWWPARLAEDLCVEQRRALTSRNAMLRLRRAIAEPRPELLKANGGGCNAILSRVPIVEQRASTLRRWPERRVAQLVRLADGTRAVNFHASTRPARAEQELARLWSLSLAWAGDSPLLLGGDLNLREPRAPAGEPPGEPRLSHAAGNGVDHLFVRGPLRSSGSSALVLDRAAAIEGGKVLLSDHEPLLAELGLSR